MNSPPETRASWLILARDPADRAVWHELVEIYRPIGCVLARQNWMWMISLNGFWWRALPRLLVGFGVSPGAAKDGEIEASSSRVDPVTPTATDSDLLNRPLLIWSVR